MVDTRISPQVNAGPKTLHDACCIHHGKHYADQILIIQIEDTLSFLNS